MLPYIFEGYYKEKKMCKSMKTVLLRQLGVAYYGSFSQKVNGSPCFP